MQAFYVGRIYYFYSLFAAENFLRRFFELRI